MSSTMPLPRHGPPPPGHPSARPPTSSTPRNRRWVIPVAVAGAIVLALCCTGGVIVAMTSAPEEAPDAAGGPTPAVAADEPAGLESPEPSREPEPEPPTEADPEPEPEPEGFAAGVWEVDTEIPAGTYVTSTPTGAFTSCYWARLSGFSGDFEEITAGEFDDLIANDNIESGARGRMEIAASDEGVEFSGPCIWTRG